MHPAEAEAMLNTLKVYVDTREQPTTKATWRYAQFGCEWEHRKLDFGDYTCSVTDSNGNEIYLNNVVAIERKMSLDELASCFTHDRSRFASEFERARDKHAKIYLLIETGSLDKAYAGDYRSMMRPEALTASIWTWLARYSCQLVMCSARLSGRIIHDILYREAKEYLLTI